MPSPLHHLLPILALLPGLAVAQTEPPQPAGEAVYDPWFLGYETEPAMDFGGRTLASLHSGISRAIGSIRDMGERHPGVAPAWEFPREDGVYAGLGVLGGW